MWDLEQMCGNTYVGRERLTPNTEHSGKRRLRHRTPNVDLGSASCWNESSVDVL